jgi:2-dehydro-3-deoxyphosphogluconate aldolase/(4S)-4-hydroxy-2-oxoglutarate aldolase
MTHAQAYAFVQKEKLVAILRDVPEEKTLPLVTALYEGGVRILEFTFDHLHPDYMEETLRKLRLAKGAFGTKMLLGCGTVLSLEEVDAAVENGAELIVSPHTDAALIAHTKRKGVISMPGAFTPTEIVAAHQAGADFVKLFPAGELGISYIKAIRAPLPHIPMMAVGGVSPENVADFLRAGVAGFGVGSYLTDSAAIAANDFNKIKERALAFTQAIASGVSA